MCLPFHATHSQLVSEPRSLGDLGSSACPPAQVPRDASDPARVERHWISLPKASPDDNAVETWVSDIPLAILDPSNDPTPNATQQVIQVRRVY